MKSTNCLAPRYIICIKSAHKIMKYTKQLGEKMGLCSFIVCCRRITMALGQPLNGAKCTAILTPNPQYLELYSFDVTLKIRFQLFGDVMRGYF